MVSVLHIRGWRCAQRGYKNALRAARFEDSRGKSRKYFLFLRAARNTGAQQRGGGETMGGGILG
jgi:hypothetical protein